MFQSNLSRFFYDPVKIVLISGKKLDVGPTRPWDQMHVGIHQSRHDVLAQHIDSPRSGGNRNRVPGSDCCDLVPRDKDNAIGYGCATIAVNNCSTAESDCLSIPGCSKA